ncbi:hypothetical protein JCM16303_007028 [Sporobolomyces ruberrimus]
MPRYSPSRRDEETNPRLLYPRPPIIPTAGLSSTFVLPPSARSSSPSFPKDSVPSGSTSPACSAAHHPYGDGSDAGSRKGNKNRKNGNPPRPPNAWICYRSARVHELKSTTQYSKMPQASISKLVGELWRAESPEVKKRYEDEAAAKKLEHKAKYPDYLFRPIRREQAKKSNLKKATNGSAEDQASTDEMPSVLRPAPVQQSYGLPSPLPTLDSVCSTQKKSPVVESDRPYFEPPTPVVVPPGRSASREALPSPPACSPPPLAPIDTSHTWTMFQPVSSHLPTPPFDYVSRASSPSYCSPTSTFDPSYSTIPPPSSLHVLNQPQFEPFEPLPTFPPAYFSAPSTTGEFPLGPNFWALPAAPVDNYAEGLYHYPHHPSYPHCQ